MNLKIIVAIAAVLAVLGAGYAVAVPANAGFLNGMMGGFSNMMGNGGMMGNYGTGNGYGSMMGNGNSMMGGSGGCGGYGADAAGYDGNATPVTIEKAKESVEKYLNSTGNADLELTEVMEFSNHFYAEVKEKSTGVHAFELLVNKYTGAIAPEMGPNMMWNTKYGPMSSGTEAAASVTKEQALKNAQVYLDKELPGTNAEDAEAFYGYYTIHVLRDGKVSGMLSVSGYTGAVWYHGWHGEFIKILDVG
ncbi:MAG: hypothetical protein FIB08_00620 [Candidatus Methanoperedens sp.]|nr:hypothetical protein [Candidatus Methanoperedens sp.]